MYRSVLEGQFEAHYANSVFDQNNVRNMIYRQRWLTAKVRSKLRADTRPHLVIVNTNVALYKCIDLIVAAIPASYQNVTDNIWPRLVRAVEGNGTDNDICHLRQNWHEVIFRNNEGTHSYTPVFDLSMYLII